MKPRNKKEQRIVELSKKLRKPTDKHLLWASKNIFKHYGYRTKKHGITCMGCGHVFENYLPFGKEFLLNTIDNICECPNCKSSLDIEITKKTKNYFVEYYTIVTKCKEFQVFRLLEVWQHLKKGSIAKYHQHESLQYWFNKDGDWVLLSKKMAGGFYQHGQYFSQSSELETRNFRLNIHDFCQPIYPKLQLIPELKQKGFKNDFHGIYAKDLISSILKNNRIETLFKAKFYNFIRYELYDNHGKSFIDKYWRTIRICIRNNYIPDKINIYHDHLELLEYFYKDLLNPKYVCPENLHLEHQKLIQKKKQFERKHMLKELMENINKAEVVYKEEKNIFFDIEIIDKDLKIVPLQSVKEFLIEGDMMGHCVFENKYFERPNSLILSAQKDNLHLETIEYDLRTLKIVQSYGPLNKPTEFHDKIIELMNKNHSLIKQRINLYKKQLKTA